MRRYLYISLWSVLILFLTGFFFLLSHEVRPQNDKFDVPAETNASSSVSVSEESSYNWTGYTESVNKFDDNKLHEFDIEEFKQLTVRIAKSVRQAWTHSRGMKTIKALDETIINLAELLGKLNVSYEQATKRVVHKSINVCPEHYTNTLHGFPNYDTGYVTEKCKYGKSLDTLVTFLFVLDEYQNITVAVDKLVTGIQARVGKGAKIKIGILDPNYTILSQYPKVSFEIFPRGTSIGKAWNTLSKKIKTQYVLMGVDTVLYDHDIQLERLVREIEKLNVPAVGMATKQITNGHWGVGCFQRAYRNYTLVYEEGYDESVHECLFCDHVSGPFLIRYKDLKNNRLNETLPKTGLFEEFFLRLNKEIAMCADSMAHVNRLESSDSEWIDFGKHLDLYRIKTISGSVIEVGCNYSYPCDPWNSYTLHPCCAEQLANVMAGTLDICNEVGAICEMYDGNLVGVAKMQKVLPWELDGDIKYYFNYTSILKSKEKLFKSYGFDIEPSKVLRKKCLTKSYYGARFFGVKTKNWRVDFNSYCDLDSFNLLNSGKLRTLVPHHDRYLEGPRNPARVVRNKYPGYTKHSEHYVFMKKDMWTVYTDHKFRKCQSPGRMDCLDQYRVDGNLQFRDPIP